jgi:UDP-glucose 4-epimerase
MKSAANDEVYNVASGVETSLLELWEAIQEVTGARHLTPQCQPPRKVNPVPRRLADTRRARQELGFEAAIPLVEGLRRLAAWRDQCRSCSELTA